VSVLKIEVDQVCIGSGNRAFTATAVFDQREVNGIDVLRDAIAEPSAQGCSHAARRCPSQAIRISKDCVWRFNLASDRAYQLPLIVAPPSITTVWPVM